MKKYKIIIAIIFLAILGLLFSYCLDAINSPYNQDVAFGALGCAALFMTAYETIKFMFFRTGKFPELKQQEEVS